MSLFIRLKSYFNSKYKVGDKVVFTGMDLSPDGSVIKRPWYCRVTSIYGDNIILKIPYRRDVEINVNNPDSRKANLLELLCKELF